MPGLAMVTLTRDGQLLIMVVLIVVVLTVILLLAAGWMCHADRVRTTRGRKP